MKEALAVLKEAAVEPPEEALKKPDLSPRANAGYSVYEEVAELRAFLEEAIQDDENEKTLKDLGVPDAHSQMHRASCIGGSCNSYPSKAEGIMEVTLQSPPKRQASAMSEELYDSESIVCDKSHSLISNASWAVSNPGDSLAYSHSGTSGLGSLADTHEVPTKPRPPEPETVAAVAPVACDPPTIDGQKIKAFASAVQGAKGLGEDLQKDLLEILHALPGFKA
ncbi:unnamed protein product [Durusdinium trenchii]